MSKQRATFDHPADIGLEAWADTLGELFEALAEALAETVCPLGQVRPAQTRRVQADSEDVEALAVDFLSRVMHLAQAERFMIASVRVDKIDGHSVAAEASGEPYDADRHEIQVEIKAVTYHQLKIAEEAGRWHGRVIVDI